MSIWGGGDERPLRVFHVPGKRVAAIETYYTALGDEKVKYIREEVGPGYPGGGLAAPGYLADYELSRRAVKGDPIIKTWKPEENVKEFEVEKVEKLVGSLDFGATNVSRTAGVFGWQTPFDWRIFMEYAPRLALTAAIHKERMRALLCSRVDWLKDSFTWREQFDMVGDCSGVGYKVEYAAQPDPMIVQNAGAEGDKNWRDREAGYLILAEQCAVAKRCCYKKFADSTATCDSCNKPLTASPGLIVHPRCVNFIEQMAAQVIGENGKWDDSVPHDVFDAGLYIGRFFTRTRRRIPAQKAQERRPWWAGEERKKKGPLDGDAMTERLYGGKSASKWV